MEEGVPTPKTWLMTTLIPAGTTQQIINLYLNMFPFFKQNDISAEHIMGLGTLNYNYHGVVQNRLKSIAAEGHNVTLYVAYNFDGIKMQIPRISIHALYDHINSKINIYPETKVLMQYGSSNVYQSTFTIEIETHPIIECLPDLNNWFTLNRHIIDNNSRLE